MFTFFIFSRKKRDALFSSGLYLKSYLKNDRILENGLDTYKLDKKNQVLICDNK